MFDHMRSDDSIKSLTMVLWLSPALWSAMMERDATLPAGQRRSVLKLIEPYLLFLVVDGTMNSIGAMNFHPEMRLRGTVRIKDAQNRLHAPIAASALDPDIRMLGDLIKPMLGNAFGAIGKNTTLLAFSNRDVAQQPLAEPNRPGMFKVMIMEREFTYRLPLASAIPPRLDKSTGDQFPGTYNFNPYTGEALAP